MARNKKVEKATIEQEQLLNSVVEDKKDIVEIRGRKFRIGWLRNRARRKLTDIVLNEKDDSKVSSKCSAALVLNGYFKIKFFYWFLWRWFYYVMQYSDKELLPLVELCKKSTSGGLLHHYNISDRNEGHDKGDDKGGSKSYPSREFYGAAWAIGEKHHCLTEPLKLFWGLWTIPMWGYYDAYTAAQIELMACDCPVTVYGKGSSGSKGNKNNKGENFKRADALDVMERAERWERKYGKDGAGITLDLSGFKLGNKI